MTAIKPSMRSYELQNVTQAFELIETLLGQGRGLTLTRLASRISLSKNKLFRRLCTLENIGIVEKDRIGQYSLGASAFGTARRILASESLLDAARPIMTELAEALNESVYLAGFHDEQAVLCEMADCRQAVKVASMVGKRIPLEQAKVCGEVKLWPEQSVLLLDQCKSEPDITILAAVITNQEGSKLAALLIALPGFRASQQRIEKELVVRLAVAARQLSVKLGAAPSEAPPALLPLAKVTPIRQFATEITAGFRQRSSHCQGMS